MLIYPQIAGGKVCTSLALLLSLILISQVARVPGLHPPKAPSYPLQFYNLRPNADQAEFLMQSAQRAGKRGL